MLVGQKGQKKARVARANSPTSQQEENQEENKATDFFSRLAHDIFIEILLFLGGWNAIPLARVNHLFRSKILLLQNAENSKINFIYSEIRPSRSYHPDSSHKFYKKYIALLRDLKKLESSANSIDQVDKKSLTKLMKRLGFFLTLGPEKALEFIFREFKIAISVINIILFHAIQSGNKKAIVICLKNDVNIYYRMNGQSPLIVAAQLGHDNIVEVLLSEGRADNKVKNDNNEDCKFIDWQDFKGYTALHHAAVKGHSSCVKLLKKAGANLDLRTKSDNQTALGICLANKRLPLQDKITIFNLLAPDHHDPLIYHVITAGFPFPMIQQVYQREGHTVLRGESSQGVNILSFAATADYESSEEHLAVLNFVYSRTPSLAESKVHNNPLLFALNSQAKPTAIRFLLNKYLAQLASHPNVLEKFLLCVEVLAEKGDAEFFEYIFNFLKDNPTLIDKIIHHIALSAVRSGSEKLIAMLLDKDWHFWESFHNNATAIHIAAIHGHVNLLRLFIQRKCTEFKPPNCQQRWVDLIPPGGVPAIHAAIKANQTFAVSVLVFEANADVTYINHLGRTLLHTTLGAPDTPNDPKGIIDHRRAIFLMLYPLIAARLQAKTLKQPDAADFTLESLAALNNVSLPIFEKLHEEKYDFSQKLQISDSPILDGGNCFHLLAHRTDVTLPVLNFLLRIGVPLDAPDKRGHTPLYHAIVSLNVTAVQFFLKNNANALIHIKGEIAGDIKFRENGIQVGEEDVDGDALEIAMYSPRETDNKILAAKQFEITCLLIIHLQKIALDDSHPQKSLAKESLLNATCNILEGEIPKCPTVVLNNSFNSTLMLFELLVKTLDNKMAIDKVIDTLLRQDQYEMECLVILLKHCKAKAIAEKEIYGAALQIFARLHQDFEVFHDKDKPDKFIDRINNFTIAVINDGIDFISIRLLDMLLAYESYKPHKQGHYFKPAIALLISQLQKITQSDSTKKDAATTILQQAAFTIVTKKLPREYLELLLDAGVKINCWQQADSEKPVTLFDSVYLLINESLAWGIYYLQVMTSQFSLIETKELNALLYKICIKFKETAGKYSVTEFSFLKNGLSGVIAALIEQGADIAKDYQTIGIIEFCEAHQCDGIKEALLKTAKPMASGKDSAESKTESDMNLGDDSPAESFAKINKSLTGANSASVTHAHEEMKHAHHSPPIKMRLHSSSHSSSSSITLQPTPESSLSSIPLQPTAASSIIKSNPRVIN